MVWLEGEVGKMKTPRFEKEDRVKVVQNTSNVRQGEIGTVVCLKYGDLVGVRFDKSHPNRHNCGGSCDQDHGWYVGRSITALVSRNAWRGR